MIAGQITRRHSCTGIGTPSRKHEMPFAIEPEPPTSKISGAAAVTLAVGYALGKEFLFPKPPPKNPTVKNMDKHLHKHVRSSNTHIQKKQDFCDRQVPKNKRTTAPLFYFFPPVSTLSAPSTDPLPVAIRIERKPTRTHTHTTMTTLFPYKGICASWLNTSVRVPRPLVSIWVSAHMTKSTSGLGFSSSSGFAGN